MLKSVFARVPRVSVHRPWFRARSAGVGTALHRVLAIFTVFACVCVCVCVPAPALAAPPGAAPTACTGWS